MASSLCSLLSLFATLLLVQTLPPAEAQTSSDSFVHSRAAYYPNSDQQGTDCKRISFIKETYFDQVVYTKHAFLYICLSF
jgi:hypothetical protein